MYGLHDFLDAPLRPGDPRRFLIEVMIGARHPTGMDDSVDGALAIAAIGEHPLLRGLAYPAIADLVDLANDALRLSDGAVARAPAIAKGLPTRAHRLAAYALAVEVAAPRSPPPLLRALRATLRLGADEADALDAAAASGTVIATLASQLGGLPRMVLPVASVLALHARARGDVGSPARARAHGFMRGLPDLADDALLLEHALDDAFAHAAAPTTGVYASLAAIGRNLTSAADRFWLMIYALAAETPATIGSWRLLEAIGQLQSALRLADDDVAAAVVDALAFSPTLPRP